MEIAYLYASIVAIGTILGGMLPFTKVVRKINTKYLIAFAAGAMLGIAFFDLLPEAAEEGANLAWVGVGFLTVYILERFFSLHSHEHEHEHLAEHEKSVGLVALVGVSIESIIDGMAIGIGFAISPVVGIAIAIAVFLHEFPRGFTTAVVIKGAGYGNLVVALALAIDASFTLVGVAISGLFPEFAFGALIAFAAGVFLYVGGGDLLPPAHRRTGWSFIATALVAALLIYGVTAITHSQLENFHDDEPDERTEEVVYLS